MVLAHVGCDIYQISLFGKKKKKRYLFDKDLLD